MAVGDQDHGRVDSGAVHQPVDLALGEVAPLDCQVYDAWGAFLGCRFHARKPCLRVSYIVRKGRIGCVERIVIAMQEGGAGAGARHAAVRAARPTNLILSAVCDSRNNFGILAKTLDAKFIFSLCCDCT